MADSTNSAEESVNESYAIVGGGIAGLAAAWQLRNLRPQSRIVLFESNESLGGMLQTESVDGYLIETSADMFTTDPPTALEFFSQLGHEDDFVMTKPVSQRAYIATENGICPIPKGFSLMLPTDVDAVTSSELLDESGKTRFLAEEDVEPNQSKRDESLEDFAVRRFGRQVFERMVQPLASGIYTADPKKLSMQATMARFIEMENQHGSLIAAGRAKTQMKPSSNQGTKSDQSASGARYDLFRAPAEGMGQLADWIVAKLDNIETELGVQVTEVKPTSDQKWSVATAGSLNASDSPPHEVFDGVILATRAQTVARLMQSADNGLSKNLEKIENASCAIVVLAFDHSQLSQLQRAPAQPFDGYGIIVPSCLGRRIIAASFSSNKFEGRAPDGKYLIRCFIGGALQSELVDLDNDELVDLAVSELKMLLPFEGLPELSRVYRWRNAMPQYHIGHLDRVAEIEATLESKIGLEVAGNSYNGVGVPVCIESGIKAANRIVERNQNQ